MASLYTPFVIFCVFFFSTPQLSYELHDIAYRIETVNLSHPDYNGSRRTVRCRRMGQVEIQFCLFRKLAPQPSVSIPLDGSSPSSRYLPTSVKGAVYIGNRSPDSPEPPVIAHSFIMSVRPRLRESSFHEGGRTLEHQSRPASVPCGMDGWDLTAGRRGFRRGGGRRPRRRRRFLWISRWELLL